MSCEVEGMRRPNNEKKPKAGSSKQEELHPDSSERNWRLHLAAADFFFLLNRSYPRTRSLELVGNRYDLDAARRLLLSRGIFSQHEALARRGKLKIAAQWGRRLLAVDGHNVQITVESHLLGKVLLKANDGALRDLAGLSSRYGMTETSAFAVDMVIAFLKLFPPREVLFLFDEPMNRSGELAALYRRRLAEARIPEMRGPVRSPSVSSPTIVALSQAATAPS